MADINVGNGERTCRVETSRDGKGLSVFAVAHPAVEDFMKGLGNGTADPVEIYGKLWAPIEKDGPAIMIYKAGDHVLRGNTYRMDMPGRNLVLDGETINLSFLRIQGISQGVRFRIRGVHSTDGLLDFNKRLTDALDDVYRNYLKPVNMWVEVVANQAF